MEEKFQNRLSKGQDRVEGQVKELGGEMKEMRDELRGDMKEMRDELRGEIKGIYEILKSQERRWFF